MTGLLGPHPEYLSGSSGDDMPRELEGVETGTVVVYWRAQNCYYRYCDGLVIVAIVAAWNSNETAADLV